MEIIDGIFGDVLDVETEYHDDCEDKHPEESKGYRRVLCLNSLPKYKHARIHFDTHYPRQEEAQAPKVV